MEPPIAARSAGVIFPAVGLPAARQWPSALALLAKGTMVHARKPVEIIAEELWDHDDPDSAASDIVEALEHAGWRLVFVPEDL